MPPLTSCALRRPSAAAELERRAVELGLALASKVLAGALSVEPERVLDSVQGALRGIVERERVIIMVNPEDLEIVKGAAEELKATLGGIEHCVIEAERRVGRGGCIVRTPVGDVDARVETKLERASEVVAAALGASKSQLKFLARAADTVLDVLADGERARRGRRRRCPA